jgi:hypothetical protein
MLFYKRTAVGAESINSNSRELGQRDLLNSNLPSATSPPPFENQKPPSYKDSTPHIALAFATQKQAMAKVGKGV